MRTSTGDLTISVAARCVNCHGAGLGQVPTARQDGREDGCGPQGREGEGACVGGGLCLIGLLSIGIAEVSGAACVLAPDLNDYRLGMASAMGATSVFSPRREGSAGRRRQHNRRHLGTITARRSLAGWLQPAPDRPCDR